MGFAGRMQIELLQPLDEEPSVYKELLDRSGPGFHHLGVASEDIDADVASIEDVFLYTIDDLREVIDENLRGRREAARDAEAMIELSGEHFMGWWRALDLHNPVVDLRKNAEANRDQVLAKSHAMLARGRPADEVLAFLANTLTNKLLHAPSANLRAAALRGDAELLRAAERLFENEPASTDERES